VLFAVLGLVLLLSLFVKRPWCSFLCPLQPLYEVIRLLRSWTIRRWTQFLQPDPASST
jgi:polyferredoxin